jgi:hypothetical protein
MGGYITHPPTGKLFFHILPRLHTASATSVTLLNMIWPFQEMENKAGPTCGYVKKLVLGYTHKSCVFENHT